MTSRIRPILTVVAGKIVHDTGALGYGHRDDDRGRHGYRRDD